jgi:Bacteriophage abortive infection AbiH
MNRLILIGNGFDLAHGMKTSYKDFMIWYLKSSFSEAYSKYKYEDSLVEIVRSVEA